MFLEDRDEAVLVGLGPASGALHVGRPDRHGVEQLDRFPIDDYVEVEVREMTWLPPWSIMPPGRKSATVTTVAS